MAAFVGSADAQEGAARLEVTVVDGSSGESLEGVDVRFPELRQGVVSDADGYAVFDDIPLGEHRLVVRHSGYSEEQILIDFARANTVVAEIPLRVQPVVLQELIVEGRVLNPKLRSAGYYLRERRGFGGFVSPEEVAERRHTAVTPADFLRGLPNIRIDSSRRGSVVLAGRGLAGLQYSCPLRIFVDGVRVGGSFTAQGGGLGPTILEDIVDVQDVAAMEAYSGSQTPLEYAGGCGALVIWTRSRD